MALLWTGRSVGRVHMLQSLFGSQKAVFSTAVGIVGRVQVRQSIFGSQKAVFSTAAPRVADNKQSEVKPFEEIPGPRGLYNWPIIGPLLAFKPFTEFTGETFHLYVQKIADKYGPILRIRLKYTMVVTSSPDDVETIYRAEGKYPQRPFVDLLRVYCRRNGIRDSLGQLVGEEWHALRTPLNKRLLKVDSALYYLGPQSQVADDFVNILDQEKLTPKEISEVFFRYAAESIGIVCFNTRLGFLDPKPQQDPETVALLNASQKFFILMNKTIIGASLAHNWYRNKTYREFEHCANTLRVQCSKFVKQAEQKIEAQKKDGTFNPEEPNLVLSLLSDASIVREDAENMLISLYNAGNDSTAKNLQTLFYQLAKNPDKQEKLREEIFQVMGKNGPITGEAIAKMPYLKACLKESFRVISPIPLGTSRILPTDVVLSGYQVPAGTPIIINGQRMSKQYFKDPEKFLPERWIRDSDRQHDEKFPKMAMLPFGNGPRNCIGRRFAEQEIYLGAAKIVQKLWIGIEAESLNTNFIYKTFVQPERPIKFQFDKLRV